MSYPHSGPVHPYYEQDYDMPVSQSMAMAMPSSRPAYPPLLTQQDSFQMPFQHLSPFQQHSPYPLFDQQPSPVYTSPAYTPAPHIMQYLSPAPSHHSLSPLTPYDTGNAVPSTSSCSSATSTTATTPAHQIHHFHHHTNNNNPPAPAPSGGRALIIGINYFNQKGELKGCTDEARNLSRYLQQVKGYRKEDIVLLSDDQISDFSQPTKENVLKGLMWLRKGVRRGERVVVYYSGHGKGSLKGKGKNKSTTTTAGKGKGKGKEPLRGGMVSSTTTTSSSSPTDGGVLQQEGGGQLMTVGKTTDEATEMETIYPVDFRSFKEGMIKPADLHEMLIRPVREAGARLTVILDTHAGVR